MSVSHRITRSVNPSLTWARQTLRGEQTGGVSFATITWKCGHREKYGIPLILFIFWQFNISNSNQNIYPDNRQN